MRQTVRTGGTPLACVSGLEVFFADELISAVLGVAVRSWSSAGRRGRPAAAVMVAALVVAVIVGLVCGGVLFARGGIASPADRARTDAEEGYEERFPALEQEETARMHALEDVVGEPLEQTWYVSCGAVEQGLIIPAAQYCRLTVATTYAMAWDDPPTHLDDVLTALESVGAPAGAGDSEGTFSWRREAQAREQQPVGLVAEIENGGGSVSVRPPGTEVIKGEQMVPGPFPDSALRREPIPATDPGPREAAVEVRRTLQISRSNIGCRIDGELRCRTPLTEPSMPQIDGYQE